MFYFTPENGFQTVELHGANIPPDAVPVTAKQHHDLMVAQQRGCTFAVQKGQVIALEAARPARELIKSTYSRYTTLMIDKMAKTFGYDNARDILTFVDDPNPTYDKQARDFRAWRSKVWTEFDRRFNFEHPDTVDVTSIQEWVDSLPSWEEEKGADKAGVEARKAASRVDASFITGVPIIHAKPDAQQEDIVTEPVDTDKEVTIKDEFESESESDKE